MFDAQFLGPDLSRKEAGATLLHAARKDARLRHHDDALLPGQIQRPVPFVKGQQGREEKTPRAEKCRDNKSGLFITFARPGHHRLN